MSERDERLDLNAVRERLAGLQGKTYWRSLQELADSESFQAAVQREFRQGAESLYNPISRRRFLQLAAASLGLAGLTACVGQPAERIIPYVEEPEALVPGTPLFFATAHLLGGYATGVLAEAHMGRPTKIEGNPDHPASLGASDTYAQASVLTLYDPDRAKVVLHESRDSTWDEFEVALAAALATQDDRQGAGLRILTPTITSPTLVNQLQRLLETYPSAHWHQYEPVNWDNAYEGARLAFGQPVQTLYNFDETDVILSLDADFLAVFPGRLRYTRDFSVKRMVSLGDLGMNRLYAVESTPTLTSSMADHNWPLPPDQIETFARTVADRLGVAVAVDGELPAEVVAALEPLVEDLVASQGRSIVLAGMAQPPAVHALAHAMNDALGNVGATVAYVEPVQALVDNQLESLRDLVQAMAEGAVDILIIIGSNPVYTAPAGVNFAEALDNVAFSAHLSLYHDETSLQCDWHLPHTHYLETWGDALAYDGTATVMQPVIEPLYENRSAHALLAMLLGEETRDPYEIVRRFWQDQLQVDDFDAFWRRTLNLGVVPDTGAEPVAHTLRPDFSVPTRAEAELAGSDQLIAVFRPDPSVWDGRFSNNAWLQELPKPFSKLTWDNAALISPALAIRFDLNTEDVVRLRYGDHEVLAPVWVMPGQAENCVTLHLGYGRTQAGQIGSGAGFNAYRIRPAGALWFAGGLEMEKTGESYELATTQNHHAMENRDPVRVATLAAFLENPDFARHVEGEPPSLYPEYVYDGYAWGMSVNLNTCIGCQACVVACQAENNIPVVGKEGVVEGREMHWLRVDDYFAGDPDAPQVYHQPVPCMHCEKAPCEPVCPVTATSHSAEGLNEMTYNRCIGTRYCSNNCPYKVRRFNFFDYAVDNPVVNLVYNPNVTVRNRGVMEKCTYCVQRINRARSAAQLEGRSIRDGEVMTACQQACPALAIVFGDISDPDTAVAQLKAQPHNYGLLAELGTRPRTTYLAKLWNPNQDMKSEQ
ncbi:MAG TPA: TAT-variant-translocated molybdopterin oxidoreductase [Anaerolineae bacterium]